MSIFVRPGDTDGWVLLQMLSPDHGYGFMQELAWKPSTILDAGANAGDAAIPWSPLFVLHLQCAGYVLSACSDAVRAKPA